MKVILKKDVNGKKAGALLDVSDGYAKNFLLRNGLAVLADKKGMNDLQGQKEAQKFKSAEIKKEAQAAANILNGKTIKFSRKAGSNGKLFGSVTTKDISLKIKEQFNIDLDKRKLILGFEIKSFGSFNVTAKLMSEVETSFWVLITE
ncbi:MAG: 50S ribosomal protein L9 [Oscillospiraceae bacterium]|jgi:large subunit ribosomal protein L9|nr:50S ribosomal protein L9 [Oscillospiraceae bacterium]